MAKKHAFLKGMPLMVVGNIFNNRKLKQVGKKPENKVNGLTTTMFVHGEEMKLDSNRLRDKEEQHLIKQIGEKAPWALPRIPHDADRARLNNILMRLELLEKKAPYLTPREKATAIFEVEPADLYRYVRAAPGPEFRKLEEVLKTMKKDNTYETGPVREILKSYEEAIKGDDGAMRRLEEAAKEGLTLKTRDYEVGALKDEMERLLAEAQRRRRGLV
jgi:hypothetical protein